jgi:hypothetical protein
MTSYFGTRHGPAGSAVLARTCVELHEPYSQYMMFLRFFSFCYNCIFVFKAGRFGPFFFNLDYHVKLACILGAEATAALLAHVGACWRMLAHVVACRPHVGPRPPSHAVAHLSPTLRPHNKHCVPFCVPFCAPRAHALCGLGGNFVPPEPPSAVLEATLHTQMFS